MPSEDTKILEYNQCQKSDKTACKNDSEKIIHSKGRWTYSLWVFNVYNMDIW